RNSRLHQGPASDRIHRLSPKLTTEHDLTSKTDDQSLRGQTLLREPTSHGITLSRRDVLEAPHTRRASPLLAGLFAGITSGSGNPVTRQGISLRVLSGHGCTGRTSLPWMTSLHVAMQRGPSHHPTSRMSGVWSLRILERELEPFLLIVRTRRVV